jgi:hypothetical protein
VKNREQILVVARHLRDEALKEISRDIARLESRAKDFKVDEDTCINLFFPFENEARADGVYKCRGGTMVSTAHDAAGMLADLTNESVMFEHNGVKRVERPRSWRKS